MALFLIEREFAEALDLDAKGVTDIVAVNDDVGVRWVYSFLSADKRKTYCLYEADSEEAILDAARRNDIPADVIVRVDQLRPGGVGRRRLTALAGDAPVQRPRRRLRAVGALRLHQDRPHVVGRRVRADVQPQPDLAVAATLGDQLQHGDLAIGQTAEAAGDGPTAARSSSSSTLAAPATVAIPRRSAVACAASSSVAARSPSAGRIRRARNRPYSSWLWASHTGMRADASSRSAASKWISASRSWPSRTASEPRYRSTAPWAARRWPTWTTRPRQPTSSS